MAALANADRPEWVDCRHWRASIQRPLIGVLQSAAREWPLQIVEPPFITADRSSVDDPEPPDDVPES